MENNSPKKKQLPAYAVLAIIALVAAVILAATNMVTRGPIKEHEMAALRESFGTVMPADDYEEIAVPDGYDVNSLYVAKDSAGNVLGYCVSASGTGYNGSVAITFGVGLDGLVTGCAVGDTNFQETPGFGARAKEPAFQEQFVGLDAVNGGTFDALSGATVTSTAVLNATNAALRCVAEVALEKTPAADPLVAFGEPKKAEAPVAQPALVGDVHVGTAKGFASDVTVSVTLDEAGAVTGIQIDSTGETEGFGQRAMTDEAFQAQFIGKSGPFTLGEGIDALSGATVTSTAVVEALNQALTAPASAREALVGTAKGFQSDVTVTLTMDGDTIASITIDSTGETAGFGQRCMEDADFQAQFVGKTLPLTLGENVDALSGATITSTAVVEAANSATAAAPAEEEAVVPAEPTPVPAGEPFEAAAQGFQSEVKVTGTMDNGTITSIAIDSTGETAGFGQRCAEDADFQAQFVGKELPLTLGENVDALSGATVTSTAVVEALNSLAAEPEAENVEEPEPTEAPAGEPFEAAAQGFQSEVKVTGTMDNGAITSIAIDSTGETAGFGQRCAEDADFQAQFVGKTLPLTLGENVDALSGATVTSTAVVEALNSLAAEPEAENVEEPEPTEEPTAEPTAEPTEAPVVEGIHIDGQAEGFQSTVTVSAVMNEERELLAIEIDASGETAGFGQRCGEDEDFQAQFIGKELPLTLGENVDALSGATVTSTAVVEALNNSAMALTEEPEATETDLEEAEAATATDVEEEAEPATDTDLEEEAEPATDTDLATGTDLTQELTAEAQGFQSMVKVIITLDENGTIMSLALDASGETAGFGQRCGEDVDFQAQFIGKTLPLTLGEDVDALSGATVTSTAVVEALNSLAAQEPATATDLPEGLTAEAKGFQSTVKVTVTLGENGEIMAIAIDSTGETAGYGQRCGEDADFQAQFIGKTLPLTLGEDVDALSGATITSTVVVRALNSLVK